MFDFIVTIFIRNQSLVPILFQIRCLLFGGIDQCNHSNTADAMSTVWRQKFTVSISQLAFLLFLIGFFPSHPSCMCVLYVLMCQLLVLINKSFHRRHGIMWWLSLKHRYFCWPSRALCTTLSIANDTSNKSNFVFVHFRFSHVVRPPNENCQTTKNQNQDTPHWIENRRLNVACTQVYWCVWRLCSVDWEGREGISIYMPCNKMSLVFGIAYNNDRCRACPEWEFFLSFSFTEMQSTQDPHCGHCRHHCFLSYDDGGNHRFFIILFNWIIARVNEWVFEYRNYLVVYHQRIAVSIVSMQVTFDLVGE